ncbi:bifunctional phosphopantothenoylcysteine decarboxylase/phosphopantothenate--cysteine ligase CoaBC [Cryobacterium sp. TMT1-21]|uniref:bifunctional phosphopantothenoylcysteine decarboxylase/phosphopantothenate--cysteine ligase CoaBC n=1 Tax=unclassified Cryobacterium TaxID=2649013 RepID=UPI00106B8745|nr:MULTISPECIES: bifunctional phosphopantothenoylcysteine decarboxylase/phosphopantothenate--cysteine ligase CoaBC [unclassified Cryobacterium]TFC83634.1 bifunctional phosphopantothenoylcysteine decarboxylase/phosphopantothenate--cysteine ligase CoaBC [Cryobacterium sp. TmT2-59]TFD13607.1 bifunctional phosphopantothenoylcysteine decarboxylase/phosphopantothenate--cysteine ligase CoaBC [Cryobacterium sp. TMT4-10]TFD16031.1 bifunctional phosphopantothenoylcysteine decarboxylase/phosphopantothenate
MSSGRTVVVGITGGIAAYKAVNVVRAFVLRGDTVHVVATPAALRFVGKPTLEAISRNPVHTDLYEGVAEVRHVAIGQSADLIVVAPATANSIAKLAAGLADDLLGNTILASTAPLVIAPAMHTEMWNNPATVANVATLRARGVTIVGPGTGPLTGSDTGAGRMAEPDTIVAAALAALAATENGRPQSDLAGKRIVITAGGTREPLDPVRFLGNRSSGKQGVALAEAAAARGATVILIAANLEVPAPTTVQLLLVSSALDLERAVTETAADADAVIMAAAVADYRPATVRADKIKKDDTGDSLVLELTRNPDILAGLAAGKKPGQVLIGFAAETETDPDLLLALGRAKLARKGCDFLVVNRVGWSEGFASDRNEVRVLDSAGDIVCEASGTKMSVAQRILDLIA